MPATFTASQAIWAGAILLASVWMRWRLVLQGGQYFFSDEQRYEVSRQAAGALVQGNFTEALSQLFLAPEHLGYKVLGIVPALLERISFSSLAIPGLFFSLFSVLNLFLIFMLSRRMNAAPAESLAALTFAALSQSLFYYSRHLMPYDAAMSFGLLSLYLGLSDRDSLKTSLACGFAGALCFVTYHGYWTLAGLALAVHIFWNRRTPGDILRRGFSAAIGFLMPLSALAVVAAQQRVNLFQEYQTFAATITQGDFAEGWSLPFEYFWHTERLLFILMALLSVYAVLKRKTEDLPGITLWGGSLIFVYLSLVIPSVFLHSFVVYGRLARQIMPFLILLSAAGLALMLREVKLGRVLAATIALAALLQAAWNFGLAFDLSYPRDFVNEAQAHYRDFDFSPKRFAFGAPELCENNGYVMQNAKFFLDVPAEAPVVPGVILLSASYPLNFPPYLYEGYTPEQRRDFRAAQLEMVFYRLDRESAAQDRRDAAGFPGCVTK